MLSRWVVSVLYSDGGRWGKTASFGWTSFPDHWVDLIPRLLGRPHSQTTGWTSFPDYCVDLIPRPLGRPHSQTTGWASFSLSSCLTIVSFPGLPHFLFLQKKKHFLAGPWQMGRSLSLLCAPQASMWYQKVDSHCEFTRKQKGVTGKHTYWSVLSNTYLLCFHFAGVFWVHLACITTCIRYIEMCYTVKYIRVC